MENIRQFTQGLGSALAGFAVLALMLLGLSGTLYKLLSPGGWIVQLFGGSFSSGLAVLAALGFLVVLAWFCGHYTTARGRSLFSDLFVYGFTAAGLLYAVRFWATGAF